MIHTDKKELVSLLTEMKSLLPPLEERRHLTHHYQEVEKRIEKALVSLQDRDYKLINTLNDKIMELHMQGQLSLDQLTKLYQKASS